MKAEELRLGNIIKLGGNTLDTYQTYKPVKVCLAFLNEIYAENQERPDAVLSVYQPVELTEEWLLKFGFRKDGTNYDKEWLYLHGNIKTGSIDFLLNEPYSGKYKATALLYVHQLQNLWYALTGTDLTIPVSEKPLSGGA